jgi:uncharacterized membrane protein YjjP (DUF1212 family)
VEALAPQAAVLSGVVRLLFTNGQTTERVVEAAGRLAAQAGADIAFVPAWGENAIRLAGSQGALTEQVEMAPTAVDMRKVTAAMRLVRQVCDHSIGPQAAHSALEAIDRLPPIHLGRFSVMAALGATALAVVFGATQPAGLIAIAALAGIGALVRRALALRTVNLFVQPVAAALLAGFGGALALRLMPGPESPLVALCPCMILVPGPHLLNGALDLARGRLPLGASRICYACLTVLMICVGLLSGLALGGAAFPAGAPASHTPVVIDTLAAGMAVLAYGTFFAMPWRMLPIPVAVGMAAHALRWALIMVAHGSPAVGAFAACLLVSFVMAPIADRLDLPFAGCAFAAVVSLIPGVDVFQMAGQLGEMVTLGTAAPPSLLLGAAADGAAALTIFLGMAVGLIIPRLLLHEPGAAGVRRGR